MLQALRECFESNVLGGKLPFSNFSGIIHDLLLWNREVYKSDMVEVLAIPEVCAC